MSDIAILNVGTAVFALGLFAELMFDFDYGLSAPWWRSWIGWMFMLNGASVLSAGTAIMLGRMLGPGYPGRPIVTLTAYTLFALSTIVRYGVFRHERRSPSPRLPMPYFDRPLDKSLERLTRKEQRQIDRLERMELRHRNRGH